MRTQCVVSYFTFSCLYLALLARHIRLRKVNAVLLTTDCDYQRVLNVLISAQGENDYQATADSGFTLTAPGPIVHLYEQGLNHGLRDYSQVCEQGFKYGLWGCSQVYEHGLKHELRGCSQVYEQGLKRA